MMAPLPTYDALALDHAQPLGRPCARGRHVIYFFQPRCVRCMQDAREADPRQRARHRELQRQYYARRKTAGAR